MTSDRRAIARLPVSIEAWEIDLIPPPSQMAELDLEGVLVVAEASSGLVRALDLVARGDALERSLATAALRPGESMSPSRPHQVRCRSAAVCARISEAWAGLGIEVVQVAALPAIDELTGALAAHAAMDAPVAPGITGDLDAWRATLRQLVRVAPWDHVSDSVTFQFEGGPPGLAGTVAIVIGLAGVQEGIVLFPSAAAHARFMDGVRGGPRASVVATESLCLYLYGPGEDVVHESERAAAARAGLDLPGGRMPHVFSLDDGQMKGMHEPDQLRLLCAVEAVSGLFEAEGDVLDFQARTRRVATHHGSVLVRSTPPALPPEEELTLDEDELSLAARYPHMVVLTFVSGGPGEPVLPAVIVKLARRDAVRLAAEVQDVDRMQLHIDSGGAAFRVGSGDGPLRLLASLPGIQHDLLQKVSRERRCWLIVSAGGAKRRSVNPDAFILSCETALTVAGAPEPELPSARATAPLLPSPPVHDPVFARPPEAWPKASATLLRFLEPLFGGNTPPVTVLREGLKVAVTVWNAVVLADYSRDDQYLIELLRSVMDGSPIGTLTGGLIERKRAVFGGDPRIFEIDGVDVRDGQAFVRVLTTLAPGFEPG